MTKKGNLNRYDLMIGDLVIAQPDEDVCGEVGTIVSRITEIFDDCGVMSVNLEDFDYPVAIGLLEPLPITKEILDKNFRGYSQRYNGWNDVIYYDVKDEYEIHLTGNDVSLNINYDDSEHAAHDKIYLFDLPYVHTLQHALRLIGYEKEVII